MTFRYDDRVKVTNASGIGTGVIPFNAPALTGYLPFTSIAGIATSDVVPYAIWDGAGNWENGYGTWTAGTGLARPTTVSRNSAGTTARINFANPTTAWVSIISASVVALDNFGVLILPGKIFLPTGNFQAVFNGTTQNGADLSDSVDASGAYFVACRNSGGTVIGGIQRNLTTNAVIFQTTSDYREKDTAGRFINSGAVVDNIPVHLASYKGADQWRPMFLAHEVSEGGLPHAVTGEKDGENPQMLSVNDLVPVLWAEVQSLRKRIAALE